MRRWLAPILLVASTLAGACGSGAAPGAGSPRPRGDVISREDIDRTHAETAYDVVKRLRATFLQDRGQTSLLIKQQHPKPVVFMDNQALGEIDEMRNVKAEVVEEIRFYDGPSAVAKFGAVYGGGVIQLVSRRGS